MRRYALTQCLVSSTSIVAECLPIRIIHVSKLPESTLPPFKLSIHYYLTLTVSFWQISPHSMTASWMVLSKKPYRNHGNGIQWWMKRGRGQLVIFPPLGLLPTLPVACEKFFSVSSHWRNLKAYPAAVRLFSRKKSHCQRKMKTSTDLPWGQSFEVPSVRWTWEEQFTGDRKCNRPMKMKSCAIYLRRFCSATHGIWQRMPYSLQECRQGAHLPLVSRWARRWINHWSLWCMAGYLPSHRA